MVLGSFLVNLPSVHSGGVTVGGFLAVAIAVGHRGQVTNNTGARWQVNGEM